MVTSPVAREGDLGVPGLDRQGLARGDFQVGRFLGDLQRVLLTGQLHHEVLVRRLVAI